MKNLPVPAAPAVPAKSGTAVLLWWVGAVALLVTAGLVLWAARAQAVFVDMVSAAIAWCF